MVQIGGEEWEDNDETSQLFAEVVAKERIGRDVL